MGQDRLRKQAMLVKPSEAKEIQLQLMQSNCKSVEFFQQLDIPTKPSGENGK